ncbi:MAG: hypothetical protein K8L97_14530 [Anaerolineae bacterium]|nr:hypothetical protein [Anaerolineae bacterium]
MEMNIDQQTLAEILQLGGQYFLPIAALLRALYAGVRGKLPEGFTQIGVAAVFAGISTAVGSSQIDLRTIVLEIMGNTVFTAGLLSFIVVYLLRMQNRGLYLDGFIGGVIGLVIWLFTVIVLQEPWPWWLLFLIIPACVVGFIALRFALRQILRVVRIATYLLVIGMVLVVGAGGFLLFQSLTGG